MKAHYSVVIIGAGPAGSNFARRIDSKRYDVLLVDGAKQKGDKPCGGLLSPDAQDLLAEYDISLPREILVTPQLFSVRTIDLETENVQHYRRSYMNVDRARFDQFLLEMVPDTVDVLNAVCTEVENYEDGFKIRLRTSEGEKVVHCDYIVGADGANSIVRKRVFPDYKVHRYVAIQQWFEAELENPFYSCVFDNETSPSCSWIFFKDGKMVFGGAFSANGCRKAFEEQKRKLIEKGFVQEYMFKKVVKTEACMVARPHLLYGLCRGNGKAFLIGEAAGFISASSLEGISFALSSGEALAQAFEKGMEGKGILRYYRSGTRKLCLKVKAKCIKRPFMYNKFLRNLILKSGIAAIKMKLQERKV